MLSTNTAANQPSPFWAATSSKLPAANLPEGHHTVRVHADNEQEDIAAQYGAIFDEDVNGNESDDEELSNEYYSPELRKRFDIGSLHNLQEVITNEDVAYADITYAVDEEKFNQRTERILAAGNLPSDVPPGFPSKLEGPLVWTSTDFKNEDEYVVMLNDDEIEEIKSAVNFCKEYKLEGDDIDRSTFPLPNLGWRLLSAADDVYNGRGFTIIRGLDPDQFSEEDYALAYIGVSSYIAENRGKQNQEGTKLLHVIADDSTREEPENPGKPFHNDVVCDTLALVTKGISAKGGKSIIASSWAVYNELAATRPDILHVLATPDWPFDTYGRTPAFYKRACLYYHDNKAIMSFSRRLLVGHMPFEARSEGIPGLTEAQAEALDAVHFLAEKHSISTSMQKGDMRFINNMGIIHRREAFVNDPQHRRHLVRMWLNNKEKCWSLPEPLRLAWARVFEDEERRGRYHARPEKRNGKYLERERSCD